MRGMDNQMHESRIESLNPATGDALGYVAISDPVEIKSKIKHAKRAGDLWAAMPSEARQQVLEEFSKMVESQSEELSQLISDESGKPLWEARTEVNSLKTKVAASIAAFEERAAQVEKEVSGRLSITRFRPHGVLAVLGPFNFPMSMPNSHVMPALLAGNAVILKPSERTPLCGDRYAQIWAASGLPDGVLQVVQGGPAIGQQLVRASGVDGVLFIGSRETGLSIHQSLAGEPEKILTLEMGGSGALVIWSYEDVRSAVHITIQSAFITAGQRCSSARRLIVKQELEHEFVASLTEAVRNIKVGDPRDDVFFGPMIDDNAANKFLDQVGVLEARGARILERPRKIEGCLPTFVRPGLMYEPPQAQDPDWEIFGPLLRVYRASSISEAASIANNTMYGLSSGIVSKSREEYGQFLASVDSGIINWNQPLTGATTSAPFGGTKGSGNHRPAGFLSVDYCSQAIASIEDDSPSCPTSLPPGVKY